MIDIIDYSLLNDSPKIKAILGRHVAIGGEIDDQVRNIIEDVRENGDEAVFRYTELFDAISVSEANVRVEPDLIHKLADQVPQSILKVLREAISNIRTFHHHQIQESWSITDEDHVTLGQRVSPLSSVG